MEALNFDLQRFAIVPTLLTGEDGNGVRYWNTIPGAEVIGFGNTFFVNHRAGCVIQCSNVDSHVYNDTVAPNVVINGDGGNDYLINDGTNVKIYGNGGQDKLYNHELGKNTKIYGGADDDYIDNRADKVFIDAGTNNDYVWNNGENVDVTCGSGDDTVRNSGLRAVINGGDDEDSIRNYGFMAQHSTVATKMILLKTLPITFQW
ncbi:MAG: hypothetical protein IJG33_16180 [Selenomonadaceae bacterium]|nr:hypothetical protein [Selenomonadaceae bacterium]